MRLNEWQLAFEAFLLDPSSAANPLLIDSLIGGPTLDVGTGLAIYHNAYHSRLLEVLRHDYPAIRYWLGDDEFDQLMTTYIRQSPSVHYSLRWLGKGVGDFVHRYLVPEQGAALAELAVLEWAFTLAFDAPAGMPLTINTMATLAPHEWPALRIKPTPSVQWLECRFNTLAVWRSVKEEADFPHSRLLDAPEVCVIWRADLVCHFRSLESAQADALNLMFNQGFTFAELCAELAVIYGEGASLLAVTWLKQWLQDGLAERLEP
ncbi:HvfC/BufC N-terminal domain-containing protein [Pseudomonas koreensis]|uniref:DNA-binding domain-containing protein n=1 Tax=Pseudomonas koreensis TaxID=198620 RepID=A0A9X2XB60_9PSED|nr:DNA-binding domain-containing protein [Pseudomonas koreensis]MCU7246339.1 DNA-binding domain-containing protein [Pseudomonas koreensis]